LVTQADRRVPRKSLTYFLRGPLAASGIASIGGTLGWGIGWIQVGYQSELPEQFYSWMGGVRLEYRRKGIATALAEEQERWAKEAGFRAVFFKTRNRFPGMIQFGIKRGFKVVDLLPKGVVEDYRIVMRKEF